MRVLLCALFLVAAPASAHRLDEYLQATTIAVEKRRVQLEIRLAPGTLVFPVMFAAIDSDSDGVLSESEQRAYAHRVLGDLSLSVDGTRTPLRLVSSAFAPKALLQEGLGEIELRLEADVPAGAHNRRLTFENRHQSPISAYLVNSLIARDPNIQLSAQHRNNDQSFYQLDYAATSAAHGVRPFSSWWQPWGWSDGAILALVGAAALLRRRVAGRKSGDTSDAARSNPLKEV